MRKKIILIPTILISCLLAGYFYWVFSMKNTTAPKKLPAEVTPSVITLNETPTVKDTLPAESNIQTEQQTEKTAANKSAPMLKILQPVPFLVQAPFGNWKEPDYQNACEEAVMIMAMGWTKGEKTISPAEAQKRILAIIAFENKTFGYSADTNAFDMEKVFQQYFKYKNILVKEDVTLAEIKAEIQAGKLVIVPAFGRALKNPNFTAPGPIAHMLVIIGYDPTTKEFITNDPGTRKGAGYRYDETLLFEAIWAYPSGKEIPPVPKSGEMQKVILSVSN